MGCLTPPLAEEAPEAWRMSRWKGRHGRWPCSGRPGGTGSLFLVPTSSALGVLHVQPRRPQGLPTTCSGAWGQGGEEQAPECLLGVSQVPSTHCPFKSDSS